MNSGLLLFLLGCDGGFFLGFFVFMFYCILFNDNFLFLVVLNFMVICNRDIDFVFLLFFLLCLVFINGFIDLKEY